MLQQSTDVKRSKKKKGDSTKIKAGKSNRPLCGCFPSGELTAKLGRILVSNVFRERSLIKHEVRFEKKKKTQTHLLVLDIRVGGEKKLPIV